ncbi:MAG: glycosyltransferase family 4 protein [bacterium]
MKILFVSPYPILAGSSRLRIHQYLPYLEAHRHEAMVWSFLSMEGYRKLYQRGSFLAKAMAVLAGVARSLVLLLKVRRFDLCMIHREAAPAGGGLLEWLIAKLSRRLIYDFDDALFEPNVSAANRRFAFLKSTRKVARLLSRCDAAIACNNYLESYSQKLARKTYQLQTPVDTQLFKPCAKAENAKVVIGWIGSHSTAPYLVLAREALQRLCAAFAGALQIDIVGAGDFRLDGVPAQYKPWRLENEVEDLRQLDIGIMPMPDDRWTKGKCGFKALLYMSAGLPVVCSPVGFNREIVIPGDNGFWAETSAQWCEALQRLVEDQSFRRQMGASGRRLVEEKFSLEKCAPRFEQILRAVVEMD